MASYPGSRKIVTIEVKDKDDELVDADLTVHVDAPDSAPSTIDDITHVSTGIYTCVVDCPDAGKYAIRAVASGAAVAVDEDTWRIEPSVTDWS